MTDITITIARNCEIGRMIQEASNKLSTESYLNILMYIIKAHRGCDLKYNEKPSIQCINKDWVITVIKDI